ncbi:hypothetical protein H072_4146 [Dactylellina haptotyla CBS 200.50]|uniref:PA14 domain-containing protein n=1 Tax=Dactylellina haptotyla (strain CBS 200.50) TaxID=1284197 RepID=S8BR50_DACHA|nr:hypothetical protein H072_4146 [Dactylellina haptotyla CBS 200.50]
MSTQALNKLILWALVLYGPEASALPQMLTGYECIPTTVTTCTGGGSGGYYNTTITKTETYYITITGGGVITETIYLTETDSFTITKPVTTTEQVPTTVTKTVTTTNTPIPPPAPYPDTSCGNKGVEAAIYNYIWSTTSPSNEVADIKTVTPYANKTLNEPLYIASDGAVNAHPHGFTVATANNNFIMNIRGYFYAPKAGSYEFRMMSPDDYLGLWVGPKTYSGWNRSNADMWLEYGTAATSGSFNINLQAGQYVPIRAILQNAGGPESYKFYVSLGGIDYVNITMASSYLVTKPCDATKGAAYPLFGKET